MQSEISNTDPRQEEPASFTVTFIVDGPRVAAEAFATILSATAALLGEVEHFIAGRKELVWGVSGVLTGHSERSDVQRVAVELTTDPAGETVIAELFPALEALRSGKPPQAAISERALRHIVRLATSIRQREINEMWFSQAGKTPVHVTLDTLRHALELQARALDEGLRGKA